MINEGITNLAKLGMNVLAARCYADALVRGFHKNERIANPTAGQVNEAAAKLHAEVSEFWEAARKNINQPAPESKVPGLTVIEEELADIVIGAFETAQTYGVNIGDLVVTKMEYNKTRGYLNGKDK